MIMKTPPDSASASNDGNGLTTVEVRRQWNDWRFAEYRITDISGMHWDNVSGGVYARAPQHFVHGYVSCDAMISGEIAHSCRHGSGPHTVKICITKRGNEKNLTRNPDARWTAPRFR
jgi:hypothetical protein